MTNTVDLHEVQNKKVNEFSKQYCERQAEKLAGTRFEFFSDLLLTAYRTTYDVVLMDSHDMEPTPTFEVEVSGNSLIFLSSLQTIQFTTGSLPKAIQGKDLKVQIKNCLIWTAVEETSSRQVTIGSVEEVMAIVYAVTRAKGDPAFSDYPAHLMIMIINIAVYLASRGYSVFDIEEGIYHDLIDGEVTKYSLKSEQGIHALYVCEQIAFDDMRDLVERNKRNLPNV